METKKRGRPENLKPWKPGESGNPGGRPKKKALSEAYERALNDPAVADAIAKAMIRQAKKGNVKAAIELADRTEGKVLADAEGSASVQIIVEGNGKVSIEK